jgi:hypothetical protein
MIQELNLIKKTTKNMRIAQVTPLWERVPPPAYGGIELVGREPLD